MLSSSGKNISKKAQLLLPIIKPEDGDKEEIHGFRPRVKISSSVYSFILKTFLQKTNSLSRALLRWQSKTHWIGSHTIFALNGPTIFIGKIKKLPVFSSKMI
jgi:hypothetical protein